MNSLRIDIKNRQKLQTAINLEGSLDLSHSKNSRNRRKHPVKLENND